MSAANRSPHVVLIPGYTRVTIQPQVWKRRSFLFVDWSLFYLFFVPHPLLSPPIFKSCSLPLITSQLQLCPTPPLKRSTLLLAISNMHHLLGMRSKSSSSFHKKTLRHVIYWNGGWAMLHSSPTCQNIQEIYLVHQVCECTCLYKYIQLIAYSRVCCCCWVYILQRKGHNLSTMLSSAAWDNLHTYACEAMP